MKLSADLLAFSDRLGVRFSRPDLLVRATTHASISSAQRPDNQRLEFLGDRVLGLTVAEALFAADGQATEGQMAPRFNALVRKETCAEVAREVGLGDVLRLGRSEMLSGGRRKEALLADAMEAVIAAVYLDQGFDVARALVLRLWAGRIEAAGTVGRDPKTALQEWAQARGMATPTYEEQGRSGPDHAPVFTVAVRLASGQVETASGSTKRAAEQLAAQAMLARVEAAGPGGGCPTCPWQI